MTDSEKQVFDELKGVLPTLRGIVDGNANTDEQIRAIRDEFASLKGNFEHVETENTQLKAQIAADKKAARIASIQSGKTLSAEDKVKFAKFLVNVVKFGKSSTPGVEVANAIKEFQDEYGVSTKDAMNTVDDGFAIPEPFTNRIQALADQSSVALQECSIITLTEGNKLPILSLANDVAVAWTGETVAFTESEPTATPTEVKLKKLGAFSQFSQEYIEDEEVGIVDWIIARFGMKMGAEVDNQAFKGSGTVFTGILNTLGVNAAYLGMGELPEVMTFDDLIDMETLTPTSVLSGMTPKWYLSRSVLAILKKIKTTTGEYIWQPAAGGEPATILGYPYRLVDKMPAAGSVISAQPFLLFGNMMNYAIAQKGGMGIKYDDIVKTDEILLAVRKRYAMAAILPGAFTVLHAGQ